MSVRDLTASGKKKERSRKGESEREGKREEEKGMKEIKPGSCNSVIILGAVRCSPSGLLLLSEIIYNSVGKERN